MMTIRPLLTLFGCALAVLFSFACAKDRTEGGGGTTITSAVETGDDLCSDGLDNDADGLTDCCDYGCRDNEACKTPEIPSKETTLVTCSDCIDNDDDGYTDCDDQSCTEQSKGATRWAIDHCDIILESLENADEACSDGIDNDGDGFTDCKDFGCFQSPEVTVCD